MKNFKALAFYITTLIFLGTFNTHSIYSQQACLYDKGVWVDPGGCGGTYPTCADANLNGNISPNHRWC